MLNLVTLIGHLGSDPEIRATQAGKKVANFRIATSERWKDAQSGEARERVEWNSVVIFNEGLAGVAEKYLKKGSKVYVAGKLQTRKWQDKDGADRYSTEVVLNGFDAKLVMLDGASSGRPPGAESPDEYGKTTTRSSGHQAPLDSQQGAGDGHIRELDDEIPF